MANMGNVIYLNTKDHREGWLGEGGVPVCRIPSQFFSVVITDVIEP